MTQSSNHISAESETPQSVDRSLLEYLNPSRKNVTANSKPIVTCCQGLLPEHTPHLMQKVRCSYFLDSSLPASLKLHASGNGSVPPFDNSSQDLQTSVRFPQCLTPRVSFSPSTSNNGSLSLSRHLMIFSISAPCSLYVSSKEERKPRK